MDRICTAVYESGVLKPLEQLGLKEHEKVRIAIVSDSFWQKEFENLLKKVHKRTKKFPLGEIEADITLASDEVKELRNAQAKDID